MQGVHLRKYGVVATVDFVLYEVDGVDFRTDWTPADGDVIMMRDEAAEEQVTNAAGNANLSTLVTDEGRGYSITLALEDMQAKRIEIFLVDQATKVFLDWSIIIETYGHASAQHAFDLGAASVVTDSASRTASKATGFSTHSAAAVKSAIEAGGSHLTLIKAITDIVFGLQTTISSVDTPDTVFRLTAGLAVNNAYNNQVVAVYDVSGSKWEVRKINGYVGATRQITVDRNFSFTLAPDDLVKISNVGYSPTAAAGGGATAQEVHEYSVTGITTPGQAGYEIQQRGGKNSIYVG